MTVLALDFMSSRQIRNLESTNAQNARTNLRINARSVNQILFIVCMPLLWLVNIYLSVSSLQSPISNKSLVPFVLLDQAALTVTVFR